MVIAMTAELGPYLVALAAQTSAANDYDRREAEARAALDIARDRAGEGTLEAAAAVDALVVALRLNGRAWSREGRTLAEQTLADKERLLGPEDSRLVTALVNLGDVLIAHTEFTGAIRVARARDQTR